MFLFYNKANHIYEIISVTATCQTLRKFMYAKYFFPHQNQIFQGLGQNGRQKHLVPGKSGVKYQEVNVCGVSNTRRVQCHYHLINPDLVPYVLTCKEHIGPIIQSQYFSSATHICVSLTEQVLHFKRALEMWREGRQNVASVSIQQRPRTLYSSTSNE